MIDNLKAGAAVVRESSTSNVALVIGLGLVAAAATGAMGYSAGDAAASEREAALGVVAREVAVAAAVEEVRDAALSDAEWAYQGRLAVLDARARVLDAEAEDLRALEAVLDAREEALSVAEQVPEGLDGAVVTFAPGTYLVGSEVAPGRYRAVADVSGFCYMEQKSAGNILDNLLEDSGRPVFTVSDVEGSEFRVNSDCGNVTLIQ